MWRSVRGRVLVGWLDSKGEITSGSWATFESDNRGSDWAVIQAAKGKLVVYRFDKREADEPKTGVIQVCDSWQTLELAVPARIFEEALLAAGIKKPSEYRDVPLEL
jgi:hypothetical protein